MTPSISFKKLLERTDLSDGTSIERYAVNLEGMTFRDVLDLGITPENYDSKNYGNENYKGGMGNLLEERFFGYRSNSDERPDFPEAGVELKATCFDIRKKDGEPSAGERLVLSMIPYDRPISDSLWTSHLWKKCRTILLIYYRRDRTVSKYDQRIYYVGLFTPPKEDLKIIEDDYKKIVSYIRTGRAHELSEGLTTYLSAATKGASEAKSWVDQYYPTIEFDGSLAHHKAKKRAFSFKRQYMDYVLHHHFMHRNPKAEHILKQDDLSDKTFDERIVQLISPFIGKSDREIAQSFGLKYTGNKSQWTTLVYRMLGIKSNRAEEFLKAGISVRVIRIEENGRIKESLSFAPFEFKELTKEEWEASEFRRYLDETRFFFVAFRKIKDSYRLTGSTFWGMPATDIDGEAKRCWNQTKEVLSKGVVLTPEYRNDGSLRRFRNNLPGISDNRIAHVRPHAQKAAYRLSDGTVIGDVEKDASELPDGRWMTRQSFWFNNTYVASILKNVLSDKHARNGEHLYD